MYDPQVAAKLGKIKGQGQHYESDSRFVDGRDGICDACGLYDTELREYDDGSYGFCRQEECIAVRNYVDLKLGIAYQAKDGTWFYIHTPEAIELAIPEYQAAFERIKKGESL